MRYRTFFGCFCSRKTGSCNITQTQQKSETSEMVTETNRNVSEQEDTSLRKTSVGRHARKLEEEGTIVKYPKEASDELLITEALKKNELLSNILQGDRLQTALTAMYFRDVQAEEIVIRQGDVGTQLYVSASGHYEILKNGKSEGEFSDNRVFGELAILYNDKRQATIKVLHPGRIWVLDQKVYHQLMLRSEFKRQDHLVDLLTKVEILNTVPIEVLRKVSELLEWEHFPAGRDIVREGEEGDKFYIISEGTVTITKKYQGMIGTRSQNEYFGELALLEEDNLRQATVTANPPDGAKCYYLVRQEFIKHFGTLDHIKSIPDVSRKQTYPFINPYSDLELKDLKGTETIGLCAFGRFELVHHKSNKQLTFTLKKLKKVEIEDQQQQETVYNEKDVHVKCNNAFILQMYKTFKDAKYLYFLLEPCPGGDLWSLLQKHKTFTQDTTKFYAASVLEALSYLHQQGIAYRNLKPENLLLTQTGYLKLTDFGTAKLLDSRGKTYTFAGTPEYFAPEVILENGHNQAVDYWALGVFIFELLVGKTPFHEIDSSYMKIYNSILRGIESVKFPTSVSKTTKDLIGKLCQRKPLERLGCQREGAEAVKEHGWFDGFQWDQLRSERLNAPFLPSKNIKRIPKDREMPPDVDSDWDKDF